MQKGDNENQRAGTATSQRSKEDSLQTFKTTGSSSAAAATVASHLLMSDNNTSNMIPNNQSVSTNNMSIAGGRSRPPPLPDNYKNNILKAKTFDENKIAEATNIGINHTNDRFHRYIK